MAAIAAAIAAAAEAAQGGVGGAGGVAAAAAHALAFAAVPAMVITGTDRREAWMRDLEELSERIARLSDTIPRRKDAETLAVLHEMRNCYGEALELAAKFRGKSARRLAKSLRVGLKRIERIYGKVSESLQPTEANAAAFARQMRALGRDIGGARRKRPR